EVVYVAPVLAFLNVICAPGTSAPVGSLTLPTTEPPVSCAAAFNANRAPRSANSPHRQGQFVIALLLPSICPFQNFLIYTDQVPSENSGDVIEFPAALLEAFSDRAVAPRIVDFVDVRGKAAFEHLPFALAVDALVRLPFGIRLPAGPSGDGEIRADADRLRP